MPNLNRLTADGDRRDLIPTFPCVTSPVQANMLTGVGPDRHGVIANGFFYRDRNEVPAVIVRDHGKGRTVYLNLDLTDYHRWRLRPPEGTDARELITALTRAAGITPEVTVTRTNGSYLPAVEVHPFSSGPARVIGFHRNPQLRVDELGPPRYRSNKQLQKRERIDIDLGKRWSVYDIRKGTSLGNQRRLTLTLDPVRPTLLALFPSAVRGIIIQCASKVRRGGACRILLRLSGKESAGAHAYRFEVLDPRGRRIPHYSRNLLGKKGKAAHVLHFALNDPSGTYRIQAKDVATGKTAERKVQVT